MGLAVLVPSRPLPSWAGSAQQVSLGGGAGAEKVPFGLKPNEPGRLWGTKPSR